MSDQTADIPRDPRPSTRPRRHFRDKDALTALILDTALYHGYNSEPDHEVGDLRDVLRVAIALLTPAQRELLTLRIARGVFEGEGWEGVPAILAQARPGWRATRVTERR
ncbi:MAG: hypothetical protein C0497_06005 [Gemmatimonas sp.]|nr:hypothetical protein [Gemmatimonas sp.]